MKNKKKNKKILKNLKKLRKKLFNSLEETYETDEVVSLSAELRHVIADIENVEDLW